MEVTPARLADLLVDPREELGFEIKNWLDLRGDENAKATFAKALLALANHGGGFLAFGLTEVGLDVREAEGRPATLDGYGQDQINGIVRNYADPAFHCAVHLVASPTGALFPIVVVPGGHRVPIRARRSGPHGNIVEQNAVYVRKPGPRSEIPLTAQEWDDLLARCLSNRRDELLDRVRDLISGAVPQVAAAPTPVRIDHWIVQSVERWKQLTMTLPEGAGPRFPCGHYQFAYELRGQIRRMAATTFTEVLQRSVARHSGWPPFWFPTRDGIRPYPIDGLVECWLGGDLEGGSEDRDPAHSDFWRIAPEGLAFLMRGYQEDAMPNRPTIKPGKLFDVTLPVWRAGEAIIQAARLASNLIEGPATITFVAHYTGLAGRTLTSLSGDRAIWDNRIARQDVITLRTTIEAASVEPNLPEIVQPLLSPLYALFDFFDLPMQLVQEELRRLRENRF